MAKALGIGGVFFKAKDPPQLCAWYKSWLGLEIDQCFDGTSFKFSSLPDKAYTVWSPFKQSTKYFAPSEKSFMINFIVDDLHGALRQVQQGGATLAGKPEEFEYGTFGWFIDPDGNKVELWQPK